MTSVTDLGSAAVRRLLPAPPTGLPTYLKGNIERAVSLLEIVKWVTDDESDD